MNAQENKDFERRCFEALSGKPKPPEMVHKFVDEQPLKDHAAMYEGALPKYELQIKQLVAEDGLVSVIGRSRGTQQCSFIGMPSAGKSFDVPLHITYRLDG